MKPVHFCSLAHGQGFFSTLGADGSRDLDRVGSLTLIFSIVSIACQLLPTRSAAAEGLSGDAELLRLAAVEQQANLEKLQRWSAKVAIGTDVKSDGKTMISTSEIVEFVYDQTQGTYWTWIDAVNEKAAPGDEGPTPRVEGATGLTLTKEGVRYYRPAIPSAELPEGRVTVKDTSVRTPTERPGIHRMNFDPLYFFRLRDQDIAARFLWYHGLAKTKALTGGPFERSIERKGSRIALEIHDASLLNRYVVDLDRGGNLVTYFADERSKIVTGTEEWTYEYEQVEGVWVPKLITLTMKSPDGPTQKTTVSRWLKNEVNGVIAPETFTVEAVGIKQGERVQVRSDKP